MKWTIALSWLLVMGMCCTGDASASGDYVHFHFNIGLENALLRGDSPYLKKVSKTAKYAVQRKIAHIAYLESQGKLSETLRQGKACFESKKVRKENVALAISCGVFAASAALGEQKVGVWARLAVATEAYGIPVLKKLTGKDYKIPYFYGADLKNFVHVPSVVVKYGQVTSFVPWVHCQINFSGDLATVSLKINHKTVCFVIDTGSANSKLTAKTSRRLDVRLYKGLYYVDTSHISGKNLNQQLGVIQSLKVGNVSFSNVPFAIEKGGFNVIGIDTLQQLGNLLFTAKGLKINPAPSPACDQPLAYAYKSLVALRGPMSEAYVNGHPVRLLFDIGQTAALSTNSRKYLGSKNVSFRKKIQTTDGHYSMTGYDTQAMFSLGSAFKPTTLTLLYEPNYKDLIPLKAGFEILKHYNVALNFDAHTACFLPAGKSDHETQATPPETASDPSR